MEKFPILDGDTVVGEVTVTQEGLMTVFTAARVDDGELFRLSVYGECEGYLGVMMPVSGGQCLKKSLSRDAMKGFPKEITHAGRAGVALMPKEEVSEEAAPEAEAGEPEDLPEIVWKPEPNPWSLFSAPDKKAAMMSVRGAMTTKVGGRMILAVPVDIDAQAPMANVMGYRTIGNMRCALYVV